MKSRVRHRIKKEKALIEERLASARFLGDTGSPVFSKGLIHYDVHERVRAIPCGGIGAVHRLACRSGLVQNIDSGLRLFKQHRPYHESDHVLNIAYNIMTGGETLDDIGRLRRDRVYLDALGAVSIPAPTTAGDFCRRFDADDIYALMDAINETRLTVWGRQPRRFFEQTAYLDADGTLVPTTGECKEGVEYSPHKKLWGYNPLIVSLANTMEPLFIHNRGGSRPDFEDAIEVFDRAVALCRRAGFAKIMLRGDTKFAMTAAFDRWTDEGVNFVFGFDAQPNRVQMADALDDEDYTQLVREAENIITWHHRAPQPRHKAKVIEEKGWKVLKTEHEEVAEISYRPGRCERDYRMIVLRKTIAITAGQQSLTPETRYFFYITNDEGLSAEEVVFEANKRCDQENIHRHLKSGCKALHAPVNTLNANWAYMVMASLAWTLKAWMALWLPSTPRWHEQHEAEKRRWLRMGFRTFLNEVIMVPAQIVKTGRRLIYRLLAWRASQGAFLRLMDAL